MELEKSVNSVLANRGRIVIAKVGLDGHDRGARVIAQALRDEGFEVTFVGVRNTPGDVVRVATEIDADVVGISLLSGAHLTLCADVRQLLDESGLDYLPIALGGLIPRSDAETLREYGVALIAHPGDDLNRLDRIVSAMDELVAKSRTERAHSDLPGDQSGKQSG